MKGESRAVSVTGLAKWQMKFFCEKLVLNSALRIQIDFKS